jgi:DNA-binding beta-propeller fold protein YncE
MVRHLVGFGAFVYEVVQNFARPPEGMTFGHLSHVAVDSRNTVYVTQTGGAPILVFDQTGSCQGSIGEGIVLDPNGICIDPSDAIWVAERDRHQVLKLDKSGAVLLRLGATDRASLQAPFNHPTDVATAPNGDLFVADGYGNSSIHHFSQDGQFVRSWGRAGRGQGEFSIPYGLWVDPRGRVYVADRDNDRIQIFDAEGGFLEEWGDFHRPMAVWTDQEGNVYVTDQVPRISIFSAEGRLLSRGRVPDAGNGLCGDHLGNLYVTGAISAMTGDFVGVAKLERT